MPDQSGRHRHKTRADLAPILAIVLIGGLLLAVALLWDTDKKPSTKATDATAAIGAAAPPTDGSRPRNDATDRATDGGMVDGLDDLSDASNLANAAQSEVKKVNGQKVTFNIASFNMYGHGYTEPGGQRASWPDSPWRSAQTVGLIKKHGSTIVGLQEARRNQLAAVMNGTGYKAWPMGSYPDNSIVWDSSQFEFISGEQVYIHFNGARRGQPVIRFKHIKSGREFYVFNLHTQAGKGGSAVGHRNAAFGTIVAKVNALKKDQLPIFVVGDMNDRANFYCRVIPQTGLVAAQGGGGTCGSAPRIPFVDWVTGWGKVTFSGYDDDSTATQRKISDHPYIAATATMEAIG